jgi:hypothetical protein
MEYIKIGERQSLIDCMTGRWKPAELASPSSTSALFSSWLSLVSPMDEVHDKQRRSYPVGRTFIRTTVILNTILATESNTSNQDACYHFHEVKGDIQG